MRGSKDICIINTIVVNSYNHRSASVPISPKSYHCTNMLTQGSTSSTDSKISSFLPVWNRGIRKTWGCGLRFHKAYPGLSSTTVTLHSTKSRHRKQQRGPKPDNSRQPLPMMLRMMMMVVVVIMMVMVMMVMVMMVMMVMMTLVMMVMIVMP